MRTVKVIDISDLLGLFQNLSNEDKRKAVLAQVYENNEVIDKVEWKGTLYFITAVEKKVKSAVQK